MDTSGDPGDLLILTLADPRATVEIAGGKGASLARMAAADLPVPPGFYMTTAAYRRFVAAGGLQGPLLQAASTASADQPAAPTSRHRSPALSSTTMRYRSTRRPCSSHSRATMTG